MIEAAPSVNFFISISDNGYLVLITIKSQTNANLNVTTVKTKGFFYFSISFI